MFRLVSLTICLVLGLCASSLADTTGYIATPTEELASPGSSYNGEITPEGDIYTGWAEYEMSVGSPLIPWNQPTRTLPNPARPLYVSSLKQNQIIYQERVFSIDDVVYLTLTATNKSQVRKQAEAEIKVAYSRGKIIRSSMTGGLVGAFRYPRPQAPASSGAFQQQGEAFNPNWQYSFGDNEEDVIRDNLLLLRGPQPYSASVIKTGDSWSSPHTMQKYKIVLQPGQSMSFTWQVPLDPMQMSDLTVTQALALFNKTWQNAENGMMQITVPEAKVTDTYQASIAQILAARINTSLGWLQAGNRLQYQAFWIRDAALMSDALDLSGLHSAAEENLSFINNFQLPSGQFVSQNGQLDATGQAIWAILEHGRLSDNIAYLQSELPVVIKAVNWLRDESAFSPLGLLPPANPGDNELVGGYITGDDFWAAAGLRSAVMIAHVLGDDELASEWQSSDALFESSLNNALAVSVQETGYIPPALNVSGGQDWGNYSASYPVQILSPISSWVAATVAHEQATSQEGLPTYENGKSLHDYLGFSIFQTELEAAEAGQPQQMIPALEGFYAELDHTTATDAGWEWNIPPYGNRSSDQNLTPHDTFSADYVALLRDMLISDTNNSVILGAGVSPAWMKKGDKIVIKDAPCGPLGQGGLVSYTLESFGNGATLSWRSTLPKGVFLEWMLPFWTKQAGRSYQLEGQTGQITVRWQGKVPSLSYQTAVSSLDKAYLQHNLQPPLRTS